MKKTELSMNPKLLDLLEIGASLKLPNGVVLTGDPEKAYIDIGVETLDGNYENKGTWDLSEKGLMEALDDANKMEKERRQFACRTPENATRGIPFFK